LIPVKLKLRNFMAYRDAGLDFGGIHLAVLTGENGAGKSSLLDAITWALWGKARAKRDDDLIYLGQTEMEVEYTFGLGGEVYRVIRKRDASKRGRSDLSFQVEDSGGWRTLTETSIRATQDKINHLMRLDYDTFINSAFLLQGRADEFTTKPPGKRKEILGDILGLGIYDQFEQRAKERAVQKEKEGENLLARVDQIEQELAREPEYRDELAAAQQEAAGLNRQLQLAEKEMDTLREQHRAINDKQRQLDDLRDRLAGAETDIAEIVAEMAAAQGRIDDYRALMARQREIEAGLKMLEQARQQVQDWDRRLQESAKLSTRKHELDTALNEARAKIEGDLREIMAKIELLAPKIAAAEQQRGELAQAQAELDILQALADTRESYQATLTDLKEETARLTEQNRQLKIEMDDIKANLTQLEEAGSNCPVCQRPLDEEHRAEVLSQFQADGKQKGDNFRANKLRLGEIEGRQDALQKQVAAADRDLRDLAGTQGKVARLKQSLEEAEAAAGDLAAAQTQQIELQNRLDSGDFAVGVVAELDEVKAELAELGYDEAAHRQARTEAEVLRHFEEEARTLADAEKRMAEEKIRLAREQARHTRLLEQTAADRERVAQLEKETAGLPDLITHLNAASAEVNRLQRDERFARDKVAAANQKLNYVTGLVKQRGEHENKLQEIREVQGIFRELQVAFGKKGVQALLIEGAIPEIEDEVNRLLSRMTDGRMHVRFETQREAKSGDSTIETLDIRISDEVGTRDYELYSGGEAFRVNFAIRVALSKVLARRAGAQLQTLVVDEGFGTQDGPGRERLVEAINSIQNDFERIIVITHIDELKDAFPVRIDVWKTDDGSQVAIR
jgi:exonuclease SbcC